MRVLRTQAERLAIAIFSAGRRGRHRLKATLLGIGPLGLVLADDPFEYVVVLRCVRVLLADGTEALYRARGGATARISESAMRSATLEADDLERLASGALLRCQCSCASGNSWLRRSGGIGPFQLRQR